MEKVHGLGQETSRRQDCGMWANIEEFLFLVGKLLIE
jgi:hypothetical protein